LSLFGIGTKDFRFHRSRSILLSILFCYAERSEASAPLLASCDAILIFASGVFSKAAGGFLKTHSLEASEGGLCETLRALGGFCVTTPPLADRSDEYFI
jgi:hypothetical protein